MKCSGMFYSLETNQNEIMMSSSLGGNQNSNLYWKTWDLCIVSKLSLVCSKKAWNFFIFLFFYFDEHTVLRLDGRSSSYNFWVTYTSLKARKGIYLLCTDKINCVKVCTCIGIMV